MVATESTEPVLPELFGRAVKPFEYHAEWAGTSWTWGPEGGDKGWKIDSVEEADAWHRLGF